MRYMSMVKMAEDIELHKQHWPGWEGSAELRRISDPEMPPGA